MAASEVNLNAAALKEAVELGQKLGVAIADGLEIPYAIVPSGCTVQSLIAQKYPHGLPARKPEYIKTTAHLKDADSFCRYTSLFSDARTRLFADPLSFCFRAVLDYHSAPQRMLTDGRDTASPSIGQAEMMAHSASFMMKSSAQWDIWIAKNEKEIPQAEFAEFIEDNYRDIREPSPAIMLEVARDLTAKVDVNFNSKVTPRNGSTQIAYQEIVQAGIGESGKIEVPERFSICIPVFYGEKPVLIEARLRFRINGGKLKFQFKLYRPTEVQSDAFNLAAVAISQNLSMEIFMGSV